MTNLDLISSIIKKFPFLKMFKPGRLGVWAAVLHARLIKGANCQLFVITGCVICGESLIKGWCLNNQRLSSLSGSPCACTLPPIINEYTSTCICNTQITATLTAPSQLLIMRTHGFAPCMRSYIAHGFIVALLSLLWRSIRHTLSRIHATRPC